MLALGTNPSDRGLILGDQVLSVRRNGPVIAIDYLAFPGKSLSPIPLSIGPHVLNTEHRSPLVPLCSSGPTVYMPLFLVTA